MIRLRMTCTVKYGQFREFYQAMDELNDLCRSRGWATATYWAPVSGANNEFIAEIEYPDLVTLDAENKAQMTDADYMKIFRGTADLIYPQSARTDLFESVGQIA